MASAQDLIKQAEQLFREKKFQDIISLLTDEELQKYNDAVLYFWKARAYYSLDEKDLFSSYIKKANEIDPLLATKFFENGTVLGDQDKYDEAIEEFTKTILLDERFAGVYNWRGVMWDRKQEYDKALEDYNKEIEVSNLARAYCNRGIIWVSRKEVDRAMKDFSKAIQLDETLVDAYIHRGALREQQKQIDQAIEDYSKVIQLNENYFDAYIRRGNAWSEKKEYNKALDDYNKAISIDENNILSYYNRGLVWWYLKEYDLALQDYDKAISINGNDAESFSNRGLVWRAKKEFDKAIDDFTKAISLNSKYLNAYYNRALSYVDMGKYQEAINDYQYFISLTNNSNDYLTKVAQSQIDELRKKLADDWYNNIDELVEKIKEILLFNEPRITHYTSLSGASAMILSNSPLRLSEGAFLNDTSEGRELFKYLLFTTSEKTNDETVAESFVERPFIGSFVAEGKNNDLTLWRMYGKEAQAEAKGCALTIYRDLFLRDLNEALKLKMAENKPDNKADSKAANSSVGEGQFTFYKVAYKSQDAFFVPGADEENEKKLNALIVELKDKVGKLTEDQKKMVAKILNNIAYLFKTAEYRYEHEVRLVVQGVGFKKEITAAAPPRVYIELVKVVPALSKIILGPKVERADEWAAAFNYHIKKEYPIRSQPVEIKISHLPFK